MLLGLDKIILGTGLPFHARYCVFAASLVTTGFDRVGWQVLPSDGHLTKILRATLVGLVGRFSTRPDDVTTARALFAAVQANPTSPSACPSEFKQTVYQMVLRSGTAADYAALRSIYAKLATDAERKVFCHALLYSLRKTAVIMSQSIFFQERYVRPGLF